MALNCAGGFGLFCTSCENFCSSTVKEEGIEMFAVLLTAEEKSAQCVACEVFPTESKNTL